jgi:DNA-binding MarR family transcriptional regulator
MQIISFTHKLIGGNGMARTVDISEMLEKLTTFNNQFNQVKKEILSKQNINASTVNLISIIGDEVMTLKQITEISELDKSTISRQINVLVDKELVLRESGEDKRFSYFELSDEAKAIHRQYSNDFVKYLDDALMGWSEEEKQMFSVLVGRANYSLSTAMSKEA